MIHLMSASIFIDWINGFLTDVFGSGFGLSMVFKLMVVLFSLFYLFKNNIHKLLLVLLIIFIYLVQILVSANASIELNIDYDVSFKFKFVFTLIFLIFISEYLKDNQPYKILVMTRWFFASYVLIVFNTVLGILGFGQYTYPSYELGYKGFFYAGNELSAVFFVLIAFVFLRASSSISFFIFVGICSIITSVFIGTKSLILSSILLFTLVIIFRFIKSRPLLVMSFPLIIISFAYLWWEQLIIKMYNLVEMLTYNYDKGGLRKLVFSGRDEWVSSMYDFATSSENYIDWIFFGISYDDIYRSIGKGSTESDVFDVLFYFGLMGFSAYVFLVFFLIFKSLTLKQERHVLLMSVIMLAGMSIFMGHVFTSGMLTIPLGLFLYSQFLSHKHYKVTDI